LNLLLNDSFKESTASFYNESEHNAIYKPYLQKYTKLTESNTTYKGIYIEQDSYNRDPIRNFYNFLYFNNLLNYNKSNNYQTPSICGTLFEDKICHYGTELQEDRTFIANDIFTSFAKHIKGSDIILIPRKAERVLNEFISIKDLLEVNRDLLVAREQCLMFLSMIATHHITSSQEYRYLSKDFLLKSIMGNNSSKSKGRLIKLIEILEKGTELKGPIIVVDNSYSAGIRARGYKLSSVYQDKGLKNYTLTTAKAISVNKKCYYEKLDSIKNNPIVRNLLKVYDQITLPSEEILVREAKRLIGIGYKTKKGKILKFRNKKSREKDDTETFSYVEANIDLFKALTSSGYMIPIVGDEKSGGRVVDSFILMPSWIRGMCRIKGKKIKEADYTCLHPNIAISIYEGGKKYINHQDVADELGFAKQIVKKEHLSFFNKNLWQMRTSQLWQYYQTHEPELMRNIINEKAVLGYKSTSRKLFSIEVAIMTAVIQELNEQGIYVVYVYDALFCSPADIEVVKIVMNSTILRFNVYTRAI